MKRADSAATPTLSEDALSGLEHDLALLTEELIARQDELVALCNLTQSARACLDREALLQAVLGEVAQLFRVADVFGVLAPADEPLQVYRPATCRLGEELLAELGRRLRPESADLVLRDRLPADWSELLWAPISVEGVVVGGLGVGRSYRAGFTYPERKLLRVITEHAGAHLENVLLQEVRLGQVRMQSEMALARDVQLRLLPRQLPRTPGVELAATSVPAREVGGDFYDVIVQPTALTVAVGDVAGKGMPAALLMGMTRTTVRNATQFLPDPTPAGILAQTNAFLYSDFTEVGMFATLFVARYAPAARTLRYANAGHAPVIFCPAGSTARLLEADGTALGVLPESFAADHALPLAPGDVVVVATDGLNEARDGEGALFGYERLLRLVEELATLPAQAIVQQLASAVRAYSGEGVQEDDQTIFVLKGVAQ